MLRCLLAIVVFAVFATPGLSREQQKKWDDLVLPTVELKDLDVHQAFASLEKLALSVSDAPTNLAIRVYIQEPAFRSIGFSATNAPLGVIVDALCSAYSLVVIKTASGPLVFDQKHTDSSAVVVFEGKATENASGDPLTSMTVVAMGDGRPHSARTVLSRTGDYICVLPMSSVARFLVVGDFHLGLRPQIPFDEVTALVVESPGHGKKTILLEPGSLGPTNRLDIVLHKLPH